jgi:hypothetical protein
MKLGIDMLSNRQEKSNALILMDCFRKCQMAKEEMNQILGFSIFFQDQEDVFIKKDGNTFVDDTVEEIKKKCHDLYLSTDSPQQ